MNRRTSKLTTLVETPPLLVRLRSVIDLSNDVFFDLCQANPELRLERTASGDVLIMTPAGGGSGRRNAEVVIQLGVWAKADGTGVAFDSSAGFTLPNGAVRAPDAAWVRRDRLAAFTEEQRERFLPLCPDFVVEVRSPSDSLRDLQEKMQEYIDNGARLGWLLDPFDRRASVYRPAVQSEHLDGVSTISADPTLPGFVLDLAEIWSPTF